MLSVLKRKSADIQCTPAGVPHIRPEAQWLRSPQFFLSNEWTHLSHRLSRSPCRTCFATGVGATPHSRQVVKRVGCLTRRRSDDSDGGEPSSRAPPKQLGFCTQTTSMPMQLPPVGWNLVHQQLESTRPVSSSFGTGHPLRSSSGGCRMGKGPQRVSLNASMASKRWPALVGTASNPLDMFGSPTPPPAPKFYPGKIPEMDDWRERKGYGSPPAYLNKRRPFGGSLRALEDNGALRMSESTMRLTCHPLEWNELRRRSSRSLMRSSSSSNLSAGNCSTFGTALPRPPSMTASRSHASLRSVHSLPEVNEAKPRWVPASPHPFDDGRMM